MPFEDLQVGTGTRKASHFHDEEQNARCYQGTLAELLRRIDIWASDPGSEYVFRLNRMAGTGKPTIPRTVAQSFANK